LVFKKDSYEIPELPAYVCKAFAYEILGTI
jgi:hypothetical protein